MLMIIEKIAIEKIKEAAYNPRVDLKPGDTEFEKLKKSIAEFDIVEPLIWNRQTGNLVGGHQRLKILKDRGDSEVLVSIVELDETKEKALNLALNKISGDWDMPKLKDLLVEVDECDFDIEITGFDEKEIESLMSDSDAETKEDDFDADEEAKKIAEPKTKPGQIFKLGNHRLMCGDSTKLEDVEKLMAGDSADLVFTDPPYNVEYMKLNKRMRDGAKDWQYCDSWDDKYSDEEYKAFVKNFLSNAITFSRDNAPFYIWFAFAFYNTFTAVFDELKFPYDKVPLIWKKQTMPISWARYKRTYEPCFYAGHGAAHTGAKSRWFGPKNEKAVWEIDADYNKSYVHPTQKPIALAAKAITNSSASKNTVLDLFGGSGSTLMAAEQLNRKAYLMELDPKYCDVIIERYRKFKELPESWEPDIV